MGLGRAELVSGTLCRKVALNPGLEEMMDAGRAEEKEGMRKLFRSLRFKVSHREDRCSQLQAYSLLKWAFFLILIYIKW